MRKKLIFITLILLLSINVVSANSTPTYWQAEPLTEVLIIDENTPIKVKSEHLIFDFNNPSVPDRAFWLSAVVSASYEMTNPTDEELLVSMVFPFIDQLENIHFDLLSVLDKDKPIDYHLLIDYRDHQSGQTLIDLDGFVDGEIKDKIAFSEEATLYQLDLVSAERIFFEVDIDYSSSEVLVIGFGAFSGHSYDGNLNHRLSNWLEGEESFYLLVLGGDIQFTVNGYEDYQKKSPKEIEYLIQDSKIDPRTYLLDFISNSIDGDLSERISEDQLLNCLSHFLKNRSNRFVQDWDLESMINQNRLFGMYYQVKFKPYETKQVTVSYLINGTMDKTKTKTPRYHFEYLLSPAKNWADFNDLKIDLFTPDEAMYVLESSVEFQMDDDGHYQYLSDDLPDSELTFTLYHDDTIDLFDEIEHVIDKWQYLIIFVTPIVIGGLALWLIIARIRRRK